MTGDPTRAQEAPSGAPPRRRGPAAPRRRQTRRAPACPVRGGARRRRDIRPPGSQPSAPVPPAPPPLPSLALGPAHLPAHSTSPGPRLVTARHPPPPRTTGCDREGPQCHMRPGLGRRTRGASEQQSSFKGRGARGELAEAVRRPQGGAWLGGGPRGCVNPPSPPSRRLNPNSRQRSAPQRAREGPASLPSPWPSFPTQNPAAASLAA
jgi:hypothetical protein